MFFMPKNGFVESKQTMSPPHPKHDEKDPMQSPKGIHKKWYTLAQAVVTVVPHTKVQALM